jgi:selenide,water dikinase
VRAIFQGGFDKLREAGVALLGGHTVQDEEVKFGYAVTGAIDPARVLSNAGARSGDILFLTKPLGTGVVGTAIKFDRAAPALVADAIDSMRTLNRAAADAIRALPAGAVHACTDITGFGLIGHGSELAAASGVTLAIDAGNVPLFNGVSAIAAANRSGGMLSNQEYYSPAVAADQRVDPILLSLLYDPQTSGGLLISASGESAHDVDAALKAAGVNAARIGRVKRRNEGMLIEIVV